MKSLYESILSVSDLSSELDQEVVKFFIDMDNKHLKDILKVNEGGRLYVENVKELAINIDKQIPKEFKFVDELPINISIKIISNMEEFDLEWLPKTCKKLSIVLINGSAKKLYITNSKRKTVNQLIYSPWYFHGEIGFDFSKIKCQQFKLDTCRVQQKYDLQNIRWPKIGMACEISPDIVGVYWSNNEELKIKAPTFGACIQRGNGY